MHHPPTRRLIFATIALLPACSSSYHPEYHPVTVSNFSQNIAYPVDVHNGGASPVMIAPAPQASIVMPAPVLQAEVPPPDFFH